MSNAGCWINAEQSRRAVLYIQQLLHKFLGLVNLETMPLVGIFTQRANHRPNPMGITTVRILGIDQNALVVQCLQLVKLSRRWRCRNSRSGLR